MPERLQKLLDRFLEWWKKFSTKQKALLISIAATIILALVILAAVVGQPNMTTLIQCETAAEAGQVKELLDSDDSIPYEMSQDGLTFYVDEKYSGVAAILLGTNGIPSDGYSIDNVVGDSFSTTEADKTKLYKLYLEERFASHLKQLSNVENAYIDLDLPDDDGTILASQEEAHAGVILELAEAMDDDQALGIAKYIATELGNETTDNITILDSDSNVLFAGGDSETGVGAASTQLTLRTKTENLIKNKVKDVMVGSGMYDTVEVAPNLDMDFSQTNEMTEEYYAPDGYTNGMIDQQSVYEATTDGGYAAVPGTDSNDDDTYVIDDSSYSHSEVSDSTTDYQNNKKVTEKLGSTGTINYSDSSISLVATRYVIYDEDTLKASGALDDMTFDEFIAANSSPVEVEVGQEYYTMIANATGFPEENITILAYEKPFFEHSAGGRSLSDYLQIILVVLILLLLGYVVFRSTRKEKTAEPEPELSVETLLESTKESTAEEQLEDIGYSEKSESRLLIEKFVEENPEAAASLLRNWLNEEWE